MNRPRSRWTAPAVAACLAAAVLAADEPPTAPKPFDLAASRRKHRPLLIFAPAEGDARLADQRRRLERDKLGVAERDILIVEVVGAAAGKAGPAQLAPADVAKLRSTYKIQADAFAAVLVGKDGGEKARKAAPFEPADLFGIIDAMPMRKDEIKTRR